MEPKQWAGLSAVFAVVAAYLFTLWRDSRPVKTVHGEFTMHHKLSGDLLSGYERLQEESFEGRVMVFTFDKAGSIHMRSSATFSYVDRLFVLDTLKKTMNDFDEDDGG